MRCLLVVVVVTAATALAADAAEAGVDRPSNERLAGLLSAATDAEARSAILEQLGESDVACPALAGFGRRSDPTIREQAVRSMDQAGCAAIEYYRSYMGDSDAWVTDALVAAIERHRIGEAIPFLIDHLHDPRNILSKGGVWSIGERAHRALRVVSYQSLHFDPAAPAQEQVRAAARWNTWYADHGGDPKARWLESGLARADQYLRSDQLRLRIEGLELLLLIGTPATPQLREAFRRDSADLETSITCTPDEPPRVTEEVPCRFELQNRTERRVALIPVGLSLEISRQGAKSGEESALIVVVDAPSFDPVDLDGSMAAWTQQVVDLAPGQRLGWPVLVGPVSTAGRYDVVGILDDLSARLVEPERSARQGRAIEARTVVRFNQ